MIDEECRNWGLEVFLSLESRSSGGEGVRVRWIEFVVKEGGVGV